MAAPTGSPGWLGVVPKASSHFVGETRRRGFADEGLHGLAATMWRDVVASKENRPEDVGSWARRGPKGDGSSRRAVVVSFAGQVAVGLRAIGATTRESALWHADTVV
jgi:hypothetical protein